MLWSKGAVKETFVGSETVTSFLCPSNPLCPHSLTASLQPRMWLMYFTAVEKATDTEQLSS